MSVQQADDLSALRLVSVPDTGPPFDGDPFAYAAATAAAAAFAWDRGRVQLGSAAAPGESAAAGASTAAGTATCARTEHAAGMARAQTPGDWPGQFARLLAEALGGARPMRQVLPWTSERARVHLRGLAPLFSCGQRPRVLRVMMTRPAHEVIEMTVIVGVGARTRALAVRLEQTAPRGLPGPPGRTAQAGTGTAVHPVRWICTDVEAA
jgi:Family of unknown function (DUF6459)